MTRRGILGWGTHIPRRRLDRTAIAAVAGSGGGNGTRAVASYDEDTTTMGVEAARAAVRGQPPPDVLWFSTTEPSYADRTNANVIHAALRLDRDVPAYDANGSVRAALGALRAGIHTTRALVVSSDLRVGLPGGPDETAGGDAAAALLVGEDPSPLAEIVAWESITEEFVDRWRTPGAVASKLWEERFGADRYAEIALEAMKRVGASQVDHLVVAGLDERAARKVAGTDRLTDRIGNPGAAQPALLLAATLESARPDQNILLLTLADGADAVLFRTTAALADYRPARPVGPQLDAALPVSYGRYLAWRGLLPVEPPRRPEPARVSAPAAHRNAEWKYAFNPMADTLGTIVTFTVDKLSYSPSPPVIFAVVDFDAGGRFPVELTDAEVSEVAIGGRVEMTFRRLSSADGVHNYFWKARPHRGEA